jgi:hypothetical protein
MFVSCGGRCRRPQSSKTLVLPDLPALLSPSSRPIREPNLIADQRAVIRQERA